MMPSASHCIRRHAALALVVALALGGAVPALAISNLSISSISTVSSGDTAATLTLAFSGDFSTSATLAVQLQAAAHSGSTALTTGRVSVTPASVAVEPSPSRLTEANLHGATLALVQTFPNILELAIGSCFNDNQGNGAPHTKGTDVFGPTD